MNKSAIDQQAHDWAAQDPQRRALLYVSAELTPTQESSNHANVDASLCGKSGIIVQALAQVINENKAVRQHIIRALILADHQQEKDQQ